MAQYIKNANIFGRIGSEIGKGLSESIPKEAERLRLSQGLERLGNQKGLTPFQQFSALASLPGITPQMIQSGAELLRQQGISQGFGKVLEEGLPGVSQQNNALSKAAEGPLPNVGATPVKGLTSPENTQAALKPTPPMTYQQKLGLAAQLQRGNPELYPDAQSALAGAEAIDQSNQNMNAFQQQARQSQLGVESNIRKQLEGLRSASNAKIPDNVYQAIENEALDEVNSGRKGELEAAKDARDKIEKISREYNALDTVGRIGYMFRDTQDIKRNLREIREDFKKRDDLENLADSYISKNGLSPGKAYYLAYPPSEIRELNNALSKLPELKPSVTAKRGFLEKVVDPEKAKKMTQAIVPELAIAMGKEGSPLAIGEELKARGYDPDIWFDYLGKNRKKLDLSERQGRELEKPKNAFPSMNDNWLFFSSGLDRLVEQ